MVGCAVPHHSLKLTREELAAALGVSSRTVARWEPIRGFEPDRLNARVLRYDLGILVGLVAQGEQLDRKAAAELRLRPDSILAMAAELRPSSDRKDTKPSPVVMVAESEDDRRMLALWADVKKRPAVLKVLEALSAL